ncbi:MAG: DUF418 domain-containing protein [Cytophagaceae bacterium]|nr:DUF418 domain-containing protein [Cytophagaceae bacterium]
MESTFIASTPESQSPPTPYSVPLGQTERIFIIDAIRGVALLGILMMNIPFFGMPHQVGENLLIRNEFSGPNLWTWWAVNGFFEGTMRGLFSLLFGAGTLLLLDRLQKNNAGLLPADVYYRRLLWLLLFGIVNAFVLLWPGDILYSYALCGLALFPFRKMPAKGLLIISFVMLLIGTYKDNSGLYEQKQTKRKGEAAQLLAKKKMKLSEDQQGDLKAWQGLQERVKPENQRKEADKLAKKMQGNYPQVYKALEPINIKFESVAMHQSFVWDVLMLLFLGMALYRLGFLTNQRPAWQYALLVVVGYGVALPLNYWKMNFAVETKFDFIRRLNEWPFEFYEIRRLFHTLGHLGLLMLAYRSGLFNGLFRVMARVGQMAFSNYLMQSIICTLIFYGYGFGLYNKLQRYELYYVVGAVWLFQIIFSNLWLHYFRFGPFEWLWRSLTYWKKQPLRRVAA